MASALAALLLCAGAGCGDASVSKDAGACGEGCAATDAGFCRSDSDCAALPSTPRCDGALGHCVQCVESADCPLGVCDEGACAPLPDHCATAFPLDLSSGRAKLSLSTEGAADDVKAACAVGSGAPDLAFRFTLAAPSRLTAIATPALGSPLVPVLMLRKDCSAPASLACAYAQSAGTPARLSVSTLPQGSYTLWLDADSQSFGAFSLEVEAWPPTISDNCQSAPSTQADVDFELTSNTAALTDDAKGSCGGQGGNDAVHRLVLTAPKKLSLSAFAPAGQPAPLLYLRPSAACESAAVADQLGCARPVPEDGGARTLLELPRLEAGEYALFVDGEPGAAGPSTVRGRVSPPEDPPVNDRCEGAVELVLEGAATQSAADAGDTSAAANDLASACGGDGPDVVYRFTLERESSLTARVVPSSGGPFQPVLSLRRLASCGSRDDRELLACGAAPQPGSAAQLSRGRLPLGEYALVADGTALSRGPFSLSLEAGLPLASPANDACAAAVVLDLSSGEAMAQGTTAGALDDAEGCATPSPDVVFAFDLPAPSAVSLLATAQAASPLRPVLTLRGPGGCDGGVVQGCAVPVGPSAQRAFLIFGALDAGRYEVWVEGERGSEGAFSLVAERFAPVPPSGPDACLGATALPFNVAVAGETRGATDDGAASCGGAGGRDARFLIDRAQAGPLSISVTPSGDEGALFSPVVSVRAVGADGCDVVPVEERGCQAAGGLGAPVTLSFTNLPSGRHAVWVDGEGGSAGKFTIKAQ